METPRTGPLDERGLETPHARVHVLAAGAPLPEAFDVAFALPDLRVVAYAPKAEGEAARHEVAVDPALRGNAFRPLHDSPRALAALLSVAAGRRLETGPESERVLVFLRGAGLVFLQNGDAHRFEPGSASVLPAGEPARVWAQGPEDALAVVLQPRMAPTERRTLRGELERLRRERPPP